MKIFNWMHRKLQHAGNSSGGGGGGKCLHVPQIKKEVFKGEEAMMTGFEGAAVKKEKEEVPLHSTLTDGAAMLTIGTLGNHGGGFLPPPHLAIEQVAVEPKSTGDESFLVQLPEITSGKGKEIEMATPKEIEVAAEIVQELLPPLPLLKEERERKEGKRTTLAHLFAAEPFTVAAAVRNVNDSGPSESPSGIEKTATSKPHPEASSHDNNNKNKNKKKKQEQQQLQQKKKKKTAEELNNDGNGNDGKLQKLITKMLKKKIHPVLPKCVEMEVQATKMENRCKMDP